MAETAWSPVDPGRLEYGQRSHAVVAIVVCDELHARESHRDWKPRSEGRPHFIVHPEVVGSGDGQMVWTMFARPQRRLQARPRAQKLGSHAPQPDVIPGKQASSTRQQHHPVEHNVERHARVHRGREAFLHLRTNPIRGKKRADERHVRCDSLSRPRLEAVMPRPQKFTGSADRRDQRRVHPRILPPPPCRCESCCRH